MATPFVQGHLQGRFIEVEIRTACAQCGDPIHLIVDSRLNHRTASGGEEPLVFEPEIDWGTFEDPTIIDGY